MAYRSTDAPILLLVLFLWVCVERARSEVLPADVQCLLDFKSSVSDPENNLASWTDDDATKVCEWSGVQCFGNFQLPVYKLLLSRFSLSSTWPAALTKCTSLQTIDLSSNAFSGSIPANMSGDFPNLVALNLQRNAFTGLIPASLGDCKYLNNLVLSDNQFQGEIPAKLAQAPRLSELDLSNNDLSGMIPPALVADVPGTNIPRFNTSSFEGNPFLCGFPLLNACKHLSQHSKGSKTGVIIGGIVGGVVAFLVLIACVLWWFLRKSRSKIKIKTRQPLFPIARKPKPKRVFTKDATWLKSIRDPNAITVAMFDDPDSKLGFRDLMTGTNNFSLENVVSTNATGTVYKAVMANGSSTIAIKRLRVSSHNEKAFCTEMDALGHLKHRNLVPLLGYCVAAGEKLLIYQYMPEGSLWEKLHSGGHDVVPWADRVRIATGAARGLAFLHHSCNPRVLHRNVNSRAILLEPDNEPRITEFGLARLTNPIDTHVSTFFNGDYGDVGYVAPETVRTFKATMKGDVYSFGVVLLELITGQRATDVVPMAGMEDFRGNLVQYVTSLAEAIQAVDPSMRKLIHKRPNIIDTTNTINTDTDSTTDATTNTINTDTSTIDATTNTINTDTSTTDATLDATTDKAVDDEILRILKVAVACVSATPSDRPSMFEVYQLLRAIGQKYNYTSSFDELPTLHEDEEHVDEHETILVRVHVAE